MAAAAPLPLNQLKEQGVQVLDFLTPEELIQFNKELNEWNPPEFKEGQVHDGPLALGAFQGLNFASSWHNPIVRRMRLLLHERMRPQILAAGFLEHHNLQYLHQNPDRMMIREPKTAVSKEMWHRDSLCQLAFGGWINLDAPGSAPQRFICVPGTHLGVEITPCGFAPINDAELTRQYFKTEQVFLIQPGQAVLFYSHIIHRIASSSGVPNKTMRLFQSWSFSDSPIPIVQDLEKRLEQQAHIPLPSGQHAPMYPMAYINYFEVNEKRLVNYAGRLIPKMRTTYTHKKTGRSVSIPVRLPPSLAALEKLYPGYSEEEKKILSL